MAKLKPTAYKCSRQKGEMYCSLCSQFGPCMKEMNRVPIEGWTALERASFCERMIITEHEFKCPNNLCRVKGNELQPTEQEALILEGAMAMLAFCSGSISGGRLREILIPDMPTTDLFSLNSFAKSAMENTTLWSEEI